MKKRNISGLSPSGGVVKSSRLDLPFHGRIGLNLTNDEKSGMDDGKYLPELRSRKVRNDVKFPKFKSLSPTLRLDL